MTSNKASLTALFQTGDVPSGSDYANFIDSCVNVAETSTQTMQGAINPTEIITPRVSATNGVFTGTLRVDGIASAATLYINTLVYASAAQFTGTVSAANFNAGAGRVTASAATFNNLVSAGSLSVQGNVSAASLRVAIVSADSINVTGDVSAATGTVYASALRAGFVLQTTGTVSAAGITQAAAAILTNVINRGKGIADGVTTGFAPLANRAGLVQYLLNEGPSANLWPPTGGTINGLAVNTPFALAASAATVIFHITASTYGAR